MIGSLVSILQQRPTAKQFDAHQYIVDIVEFDVRPGGV